MALHRSPHRDDFDVEARTPSLGVIIGLALLAILLGLALVSAAGLILLGP